MHAGGVLDPGVISNITAKAVRTEFAGKVSGALALSGAAGLANPLRVANLFSSLAAFSGSGGQGGYAAANGALDAMAQSLQARPWCLTCCGCAPICKSSGQHAGVGGAASVRTNAACPALISLLPLGWRALC